MRPSTLPRLILEPLTTSWKSLSILPLTEDIDRSASNPFGTSSVTSPLTVLNFRSPRPVNSATRTTTSPLTVVAWTELACSFSSRTSPLTLLARTSPPAPVMSTSPLTELADTSRFDGIDTWRLIERLFHSRSSLRLLRPFERYPRSSQYESSVSYNTQTVIPRRVGCTSTLMRSKYAELPRLMPTISTRPLVDGTTEMSPVMLWSETSPPDATTPCQRKSACRCWASTGDASTAASATGMSRRIIRLT